MNSNNDVIIPISLDVSERGAEDGLDRFVDRLRRQAKEVNEMLSSTPNAFERVSSGMRELEGAPVEMRRQVTEARKELRKLEDDLMRARMELESRKSGKGSLFEQYRKDVNVDGAIKNVPMSDEEVAAEMERVSAAVGQAIDRYNELRSAAEAASSASASSVRQMGASESLELRKVGRMMAEATAKYQEMSEASERINASGDQSEIYRHNQALEEQRRICYELMGEYERLKGIGGDSMNALSQDASDVAQSARDLSDALRQVNPDVTRGLSDDLDTRAQQLKEQQARLQSEIRQGRSEISELQLRRQELLQQMRGLDARRDSGEIKNLQTRRFELSNEIISRRRELLRLQREMDLTREEMQRTNENLRRQADESFGGNFINRTAYYNLRQIRLIQSEIEHLSKNARKVEGVLKSALTNTLKAVTSLALGFTNLRKSVDKTRKTNDRFGKGLVRGFWSLMRYALGIRSLYALLNRMRTALSEGMKNLVLYSEHVNRQMSSLATTSLYTKNTMAALAQPFLNILAPALEYLSERFADLTFQISQLVATLTGQTFVYRAKRVYVDYAKTLGNAADEASRLGKELGKYDKLDVIKRDDDKGMPDPSEMFETIEPISGLIDDIGKKVRQIASEFIAPIKEAWDNVGSYVMMAWEMALNAVWDLMRSIGRDFLTMWNEAETVAMWEDIFRIAGDLLSTINNIAVKLRIAWDENAIGLSIWEHMRDIVATLVGHVRDVTKNMVNVTSQMDFRYLLETFDGLLASLNRVADFVGGVFSDIMRNVVVKYIDWLISYGLPNLNNAIADVANNFDWEGLRKKLEPVWEAVRQLMEASFFGISDSIRSLGSELNSFTQSKAFAEFLDNLKGFISSIKPEHVEKLFTAVGKAILNVAKGFVKFFNSGLVQAFLDGLIEFMDNASSDDIAAVLTAISTVIVGFKFGAFLGRSYLNFREFITIISAIRLPQLMDVAEGFAVLATNIGLLVVAIGELGEALNLFNEWGAADRQKALPKIGTDANGACVEVNGLLGVLYDLHNFLAEKFGLFGGKTLAKTIIIPSDVEKLETMKLELMDMNSELERQGLLTDSVREKSESVYQMWYENGEKFSGMNETQVGIINSNYLAVKDYYEQVTNNEAPKKAVEEMSVKMSDLKAAMPTRSDGENSMRETTDGMSDVLSEETDRIAERGIAEMLGKAIIDGIRKGVIDRIAESRPAKWFASIIDEFKHLFGIHSPSTVFESFGISIIDGLRQGVAESVSALHGAFDELMRGINERTLGPIMEMRNEWNRAFESLRESPYLAFEYIAQSIRGPMNAILSSVEAMANGVIDAFNWLGDRLGRYDFSIPDWVPEIGGNSFSIGLPNLSRISIPRLAQGAVIPPNKEFLAMLGDQSQGTNIETPLSTMVEAFRTALREENGGRQAQPIMLQLDGRTVARVVWDETEKRYKQTGQYVPSLT